MWPFLTGGLHALFLFDVLTGARILYTRDILPFVLPFKAEAGRILADGFFPHLSARLMSGMPLWAHPSAEIADPTTTLFAFMDPSRAFGWSIVVHATLCAAGAYLLARRLGLRSTMAGWASLAYAFSGPVLSVWTIKAIPSVTLPFVALGGAMLARGRMAPGVVVTAVSVAFALLHPDPPAVGSAAFVALVLCAVRARSSERLRRIGVLAASGTLGLLLCGPYIFPALDVILASPRHDVTNWSAESALGARWLELIAPGGLGVPGATGELMGILRHTTTALPFAGSLYVGGTALVGLLMIAFMRVRRTDRALLLIGVLLVVLAHGDAVPGAGAFWSLIHARFPDKVLTPAYLCLILVAARALSALLARCIKPPAAVLAMIAIAFIVIAASSGWWASWIVARASGQPVTSFETEMDLLSGQLAVGAALIGCAAGLLFVVTKRPIRRAPQLLCVLALVEGFVSMSASLVTAPRGVFDGQHAAGAGLIAHDARVLCCHPQRIGDIPPTFTRPDLPGWTAAAENAARLGPTVGALHGYSYPLAPDVGGFDPVETRALMLFGLPKLTAPEALAVLAHWGIEWVVTTETVAGVDAVIEAVHAIDRAPQPALSVYRLKSPAPPLYATERWTAATSALEALRLLVDAPKLTAVLTTRQLPPPPAEDARDPSSAQRALIEDRDAHIAARVESERPVLFVAARSARKGWTATIDGAVVPLMRTNVLHQSVYVPAGTHVVEWHYRTPYLWPGIAAATFATVLLIAMGLRRRTRNAND